MDDAPSTRQAGTDAALLELDGVTKSYGGVAAVDGVSFALQPGESLGIIGPNGAGKTTSIGLISGGLPLSAGRITMDGHDITGLGAAARTRLGIGRTHQIPRPFGRMTVLENLMIAGRHARGPRESIRATRERCREILERTGLADQAGALGGRLPLLGRKRLELARALALRPRVLLLDEIGAGLVEHETTDLIALITQVRTEVEGLILIEHVMDVVTACCERTIVLDFGRLIAEGATRDVLADPNVAAVYLGTASASRSSDAPDTGPDPADVPDATSRGIAGDGADRISIADRADAASESPTDRPAAESAEPRLEVRGLEASYGGVRALRGVDLDVGPGEVVALLGANGAGKTTLAHAISGAVRPRAGTITWNGRSLARLRPDQVTAAGIAHCMEGRRIFGTLSVEENLRLAADGRTKSESAEALERVYSMFPVLAERRRKPGTAMSGGQQQMLAIGRALMAAPKLVVFDEISLGLAPVAVDTLYSALATLRDEGIAMLLVEQNLQRGLSLADRAYVLAQGSIVLEGDAERVRHDPTLASLYVGESGPQ